MNPPVKIRRVCTQFTFGNQRHSQIEAYGNEREINCIIDIVRRC